MHHHCSAAVGRWGQFVQDFREVPPKARTCALCQSKFGIFRWRHDCAR